MSSPPAIGKTASVKVDAQMYDDLETMLATGMTVSDAVRSALRIVAGVYRKTWDADAVPTGTRPDIDRYWITLCDAGQWPARGSMQTHVPTVYRLRPTADQTGATARPTPRPTVPPDGTTGAPRRPTPVRPGGA